MGEMKEEKLGQIAFQVMCDVSYLNLKVEGLVVNEKKLDNK